MIDGLGIGVSHGVAGLIDGVPERMGVPKQPFMAVPETQTGAIKSPASVSTQDSMPKLPPRFVKLKLSKKQLLNVNVPPPKKCRFLRSVLFVMTLSLTTNAASDAYESKIPSYEDVDSINSLDLIARHRIHVDPSISSNCTPFSPAFNSITKKAKFK
jgi:hypothetical protein